jgi:predicted aspartyl protease
MGKVRTTLTVTNLIDDGLAKRGLMDRAAVRSVTVSDVLVDTGAITLCLPPALFQALGADAIETVPVDTATGPATARIARGVLLTVEGRNGTVDCLELPSGTQTHLGVLPLEALGIELDLRNERLILLPEQDYLTIL